MSYWKSDIVITKDKKLPTSKACFMVPLLKGLSKICPRKMSPVSMSVGFPVWIAVMQLIFLKVIGLWVWTAVRPARAERENSELRTNLGNDQSYQGNLIQINLTSTPCQRTNLFVLWSCHVLWGLCAASLVARNFTRFGGIKLSARGGHFLIFNSLFTL